MQVLVTGGAGFIGGNLFPVLFSVGIEPVVVDDLSAGISFLPEGTEIHRLTCRQLCDNPELFKGVDAIVHLAGKPSVQFANENPLESLEANVSDTLRVMLAASNSGVKRLVFASSNAVVGTVPGPIHEEILPRPISFYGASKLGAEAFCLASASYLGMETVILRFANVYGPQSSHKPSVVHKFIKTALAGDPVAIYGDGHQTRDFIFVEDVCQGILQAIRQPYSAGMFQIGSGKSTSILQIIDMLEDVLGRPIDREFAEARPGDVKHSVSDIGRARQHLAWEPRISLKDGLSRTVEYYRSVSNIGSLVIG